MLRASSRSISRELCCADSSAAKICVVVITAFLKGNAAPGRGFGGSCSLPKKCAPGVFRAACCFLLLHARSAPALPHRGLRHKLALCALWPHCSYPLHCSLASISIISNTCPCPTKALLPPKPSASPASAPIFCRSHKPSALTLPPTATVSPSANSSLQTPWA